MSLGCFVEHTTHVDGDTNTLVCDLLSRHTEALIIGVTSDGAEGKSRLTIYSKSPEEGGTLFPYLTVLLGELIDRHERKANSRSATNHHS